MSQHHEMILTFFLLILLPSIHAFTPPYSRIFMKYKQNGSVDRKSTILNVIESYSTEKSYVAMALNRRDALQLGITTILLNPPSASATSSTPSSTTTPLLTNYNPLDYTTRPSSGRSISPLKTFLPPLKNRATYRYTLSRNTWRLEQLLAFTNVTATIATNVVKLQDGGLWVHGPLWPTGEYCSLLDELGEVRHVVLPVNALEHKAPLQAFVERYPRATVWIAPGQYGPFGSSESISTNSTLLETQAKIKKARQTMKCRIDGILPIGNSQDAKDYMLPPWSNEFDFYTLYADLPKNAGPVSECAFVHKPTNTLFVTDAVICVPSLAYPIPPIFSSYFDENVLQDETFWPRTVLQAVFLPLRQEEGIYPGYTALQNRVIRAPILRAFADARAPTTVRDWVRTISRNEFDRIVTSHFASPVAAGPALFSRAFDHLGGSSSFLPPVSCKDWDTLDQLNGFIEKYDLGAPVIFDYKADCKNYS